MNIKCTCVKALVSGLEKGSGSPSTRRGSARAKVDPRPIRYHPSKHCASESAADGIRNGLNR